MTMTARMGLSFKTGLAEKGLLQDGGYGVTYAVEPDKELFTVIAWVGKANRPAVYAYARTEERATKCVEELIERTKRNAEDKAKYAAEKREATKANQEGFKVGQLLSYLWGYDQTQVEFFQVIGKSKSGASVTIRPILSKSVEQYHHDAEKVTPAKDSFCGEAFTKRVGSYGVSMAHGSASPIEEGETRMRTWGR